MTVDPEVLVEFVKESNAIESIYVGEGHPLYDSHLTAAQLVALDPLYWVGVPRELHRILMESEPDILPGEYRKPYSTPYAKYTGNVQVGSSVKMDWQFVPDKMSDLIGRAVAFCAIAAGPNTLKKGSLESKIVQNILTAWDLHYEFEHIHPFMDGNGRTGRLWMNAVRLSAGLEWATVYAATKYDYYDAIRAYEASL